MDVSAVTLKLAEKSTGKLEQLRESMDGVQCVEESAAIRPWTMDLTTISGDKSAAVMEKITWVSFNDLADSWAQRETTMLSFAQQAYLYVQHALNVTGTKTVTEDVAISPFPKLRSGSAAGHNARLSLHILGESRTVDST